MTDDLLVKSMIIYYELSLYVCVVRLVGICPCFSSLPGPVTCPIISKSSADLTTKLHTKYNMQLKDMQKLRLGLCNNWEKKVNTERMTSVRLMKENNKLKTDAATATTNNSGK